MVDLHATGQTEQGATGARVPVGRAEASKGGYQINAVAVLHLGGEVLGIQRIVDHLELVAQPLHGGTTIEDGAFKGVVDLALGTAGDGGEQAMLGLHGLGPGVHQ